MTQSISANLETFTQALQSGKKIGVDPQGNWHYLGLPSRILCRFSGFEKKRLEKIGSAFSKELDRLEKIPVQFGGAPQSLDALAKAVKEIKHQLKVYGTSRKISAQYKAVAQRYTALRYRAEEVNGGLDSAAATDKDLQSLEDLASRWKQGYSLYQVKELTDLEKEKLKQAASYPKFVKLLEADSQLRGFFFRWALRDNNSVEAFVQFPATCNRLKTALLAGRVGYFANRNFPFVQKQKGEKVFALPFQLEEGGNLVTKEVSILDENRIVNLRGGYELTIRKVMEVFKDKNKSSGRLEFFGEQGICNWHTHEHGWWNPEEERYEQIDISEENGEWWKQLPVWEQISEDKAKERYGLTEMESGQWIAVAKSSRESTTQDIEKTHGYLDILIPSSEHPGKYQVVPIGKFAKKFPQSLKKIFFPANTVEARFEYPDANSSYSHRQQAATPFLISPEKGRELMESVRKDLFAARSGNVVFQFAWENCAYWAQKKLEGLLGKEEEGGKVPNLFASPLLAARPKMQPLKSIFNTCRDLPERLGFSLIKIVAYILGAWRGRTVEENGTKVFKSVRRSGFWKKCNIFHPTALHQKIQAGQVAGRVYFGNQFATQKA